MDVCIDARLGELAPARVDAAVWDGRGRPLGEGDRARAVGELLQLAHMSLDHRVGGACPAQRTGVVDEHEPRHVHLQQGPGRAQHVLQRPGEAPYNVEGVQRAKASRQLRRFDRHGSPDLSGWPPTGGLVSGPEMEMPGTSRSNRRSKDQGGKGGGRCYGEGLRGIGAGSSPPIPAAARMPAGPVLLAASAAIAIAIPAAAVVPAAGPPARPRGPGPLWSPRSCGRLYGGTSPRGRGGRPRPRGGGRCPRRPG